MKSLFTLLGQLRNYRWWVAGNIICNILMVFFSIASLPAMVPFIELLFQQEIVQEPLPAEALNRENWNQYLDHYLSSYILENGKANAMRIICIGIVLLFALKNLFRYLSIFCIIPAQNGMVRDMRQQLFDRSLILPLSYFSEERKGDLISRVTSDVQEVQYSILAVLETMIREPLMLAGALGYMLWVSPKLTGFVFILLIFTGVIVGGIGRVLKKHAAYVHAKLGEMVSVLEESLSGMRINKGFNAGSYQSDKFSVLNDQYRNMLTKVSWRRDLSSPLTETLGVATVALLIYYGFYQIEAGNIESGTFLPYLIAFYLMIEPAKKFTSASYNVQKGLAALDRINFILEAPTEDVTEVGKMPLPEFRERIELKNLTFVYPRTEQAVLENINLLIPKGKIVALVGQSGSGKSTLVDLLPRFYECERGQLLLDGQPIQDYRLADLRELFGIVSQEAVLFNDTIYNNIVFGLPNVTPEQVEEAARIANAHDFIEQTPKGYHTNIGDRGAKLSGGQRQRITIARAILRNPPILILDEATSALDSESEQLVKEALDKVMQNRTSVVIAHRLSTIQHADEIIVLREGRIVERGKHNELLENTNGEYARLVTMQNFAEVN